MFWWGVNYGTTALQMNDKPVLASPERPPAKINISYAVVGNIECEHL